MLWHVLWVLKMYIMLTNTVHLRIGLSMPYCLLVFVHAGTIARGPKRMQGENTHILGNNQDTFLLRSSTVDVAHFRYFVSERRGCLTPNRWDVNNLDFETKNVL